MNTSAASADTRLRRESLADRSVDVLSKDASLPPGYVRKTLPAHISPAFTDVTRFSQRVVNLAPVRKHDAPYPNRHE